MRNEAKNGQWRNIVTSVEEYAETLNNHVLETMDKIAENIELIDNMVSDLHSESKDGFNSMRNSCFKNVEKMLQNICHAYLYEEAVCQEKFY